LPSIDLIEPHHLLELFDVFSNSDSIDLQVYRDCSTWNILCILCHDFKGKTLEVDSKLIQFVSPQVVHKVLTIIHQINERNQRLESILLSESHLDQDVISIIVEFATGIPMDYLESLGRKLSGISSKTLKLS